MSFRILTVISAFVVALGVGAAWWFLGQGEPDRISTDPTTAIDDQRPMSASDRDAARPDAGIAVAAPGPEVTPEATPTPTAAVDEQTPDARGATIIGQVVDEQGAPVRSTEVTLLLTMPDMHLLIERGLETPARERAKKVKTDDEGRFRFDGVTARRRALLRARPEMLCDANVSVDVPEGEKTLDVGRLVAKVGGTVGGVVVDDRDRPVAGAIITAMNEGTNALGFIDFGITPDDEESRRTATTSEEGRFRISGLPEGYIDLGVRSEVFRSRILRHLKIEKERPNDGLRIKLDRGGTITGIVTDEAGEPVAGAEISLRPEQVRFGVDASTNTNGIRSAKTDAEGRFSVRGLAMSPMQVTAKSRGFADAKLGDVVPDGQPASVIMVRSGVVWGTVSHSVSKEAIAEFEIVPSRFGGMTFGRREEPASSRTMSVLRGAEAAAFLDVPESPHLFAIVDVPSSRIRLVVKAEGFAETTVGAVEVKPGERLQRDISLPPESTLEGVVRDDTGAPVAHVAVDIAPKEDGEETPIEFSGRAGRAIRLGSSGPSKDVDLPTRQSVETDADGRFVARHLRAGEYRVSANHPDFCQAPPVDVTLAAGEEKRDVALVVEAGGSLSGTVYDAEHAPLAGGAVDLEREIVQETPETEVAMGEVYKSARADKDGKYVIHGLPPGAYRAKVKPPKAESNDRVVVRMARNGPVDQGGTRVEIEARKDTKQDLQLPPMSRVVGFVREAGAPAAGVKVTLSSPGEFGGFLGGGHSATTDSNGRYEIDDLEPGNYNVEVKPIGAPNPRREEVAVAARSEVRKDIDLPTGIIRGRVVDATGKGIEGVNVSAEAKRAEGEAAEPVEERVMIAMITTGGDDDDPMVFSGDNITRIQTDIDGRYELRNLEPRDFKVKIEGGGVIGQERDDVHASADKPTEGVDFTAVKGSIIVVRPRIGDAGGVRIVNYSCQDLANADDNDTQIGGTKKSVRFEGKKPGRYRISATFDGTVRENTVDLGEGDTKEVVLSFD